MLAGFLDLLMRLVQILALKLQRVVQVFDIAALHGFDEIVAGDNTGQQPVFDYDQTAYAGRFHQLDCLGYRKGGIHSLHGRFHDADNVHLGRVTDGAGESGNIAFGENADGNIVPGDNDATDLVLGHQVDSIGQSGIFLQADKVARHRIANAFDADQIFHAHVLQKIRFADYTRDCTGIVHHDEVTETFFGDEAVSIAVIQIGRRGKRCITHDICHAQIGHHFAFCHQADGILFGEDSLRVTSAIYCNHATDAQGFHAGEYIGQRSVRSYCEHRW